MFASPLRFQLVQRPRPQKVSNDHHHIHGGLTVADTAPMTRREAVMTRNRLLRTARDMARQAASTDLHWGWRYHAAVVADDCIEVAREFDWLIKAHPLET